MLVNISVTDKLSEEALRPEHPEYDAKVSDIVLKRVVPALVHNRF